MVVTLGSADSAARAALPGRGQRSGTGELQASDGVPGG